MFCPNCGTKLPDDATFCSECGSALRAQTAAARSSVAPAPAPTANPYGASAPQGAYSRTVAPQGYPAPRPGITIPGVSKQNGLIDRFPVILAAVAIVVAIMMPLKWITIDMSNMSSLLSMEGVNVTIPKMGLSVPSLFDSTTNMTAAVGLFSDIAALSSGSSSSSSSELTAMTSYITPYFKTLNGMVGFFTFLWYLSIIAVLLAGFSQFVGTKHKNQLGIVGFALSTVTSLAFITTVGAIQSAINQALSALLGSAGISSSSSLDSETQMVISAFKDIVVASPWVWIAFILSLVGLAASIFLFIQSKKTASFGAPRF